MILSPLYIFFNLIVFAFSWEKHDYPKFQNLSDIQFSELYLNLKMEDLSTNFPKKNYSLFTSLGILPESFDSRARWPKCIHPVTNQV